jgi:hypothetical protein
MLAGLLVSPTTPYCSCSAKRLRHYLLQPPQRKHLQMILRIAPTMSLLLMHQSYSHHLQFLGQPGHIPSCAAILSTLVALSRATFTPYVRPTTLSDRADWTLHVSRSAQITDKPTAVPIVAIFGWHDRGPGRQMSYARPDIAVGDPDLLHVLYRIGQSQYNVRVDVPEYFGYWEPNQFMTFSPTGPAYITTVVCLYHTRSWRVRLQPR